MSMLKRWSKLSLIIAALMAWGIPAAADIIAVSDLGTIESEPDDSGLDPVEPSDDPLTSFDYEDGSIEFEDRDGNGLTMRNSDGSSPWWWEGEGAAFTTSTDTIVLSFEGLDVFGFTFNLGANMNAIGWIEAYFTDRAGNQSVARADNLRMGPGNSPGFGVFASAGGSCSTISQIVVDPTQFEWGIGNMAIDTGSCDTVSVPEPGSMGLLAAGLLALGGGSALRRRRT